MELSLEILNLLELLNSSNVLNNNSQPLLNVSVNTDRSSFSYQSTPNDTENFFVLIFFVSLYSIVAVLSTIGNLLILIIIMKSKQMRSVQNMFIANIALANLIYTSCAPFQFISQLYGYVFDFMCKDLAFISTFAVNINTFTLIAASMECHIGIVYPFKQKLNKKGCLSIIFLVWFLAILSSLPWELVLELKKEQVFIKKPFDFYKFLSNIKLESTHNQTANIRSLNSLYDYFIESKYLTYCISKYEKMSPFRVYLFFLFFVQYLLPLLVLCTTNVKIAYYAYMINSNIGNKCVKYEFYNVFKDKNKKKLVKTLLSIIFCFIICWFPLQINVLIYSIDPNFTVTSLTKQVKKYAWIAAHLLAFSHFCYNPFLNCLLNKKFKKQIYILFKCNFKRPKHALCNRNQSYMFASSRNNKQNQPHYNRIVQNKEVNKQRQLIKFDRINKHGKEFENTNKMTKKDMNNSMVVVAPTQHIERINCDYWKENFMKTNSKPNQQKAFNRVKEENPHQIQSSVYLSGCSKCQLKANDSCSSVRCFEKIMNDDLKASKSLSLIRMKLPFLNIKAQNKQQKLSQIFKGHSHFLNSYSSTRKERMIFLFNNQHSINGSSLFSPPTNRLEQYNLHKFNKYGIEETSKSPSANYSSYCHANSNLHGKNELSNSMIDLYYLHKQNASTSFLRSSRLNRFILKKKISLGSNNNLSLINNHTNACGLNRNTAFKETECKCCLTKQQCFNPHRFELSPLNRFKCSYQTPNEDEFKQFHYSL